MLLIAFLLELSVDIDNIGQNFENWQISSLQRCRIKLDSQNQKCIHMFCLRVERNHLKQVMYVIAAIIVS